VSKQGARRDIAYDNYDLKAEAPEAKVSTVQFAFEFPELLALFRKADEEAGRARDRNRAWGTAGVGLVLVALLYAAAAPVLRDIHNDVHKVLGFAAAVFGFMGTILGLSGLSHASQRRRWLAARWTTETLRLFHFHYIAARVPEIEAAAKREDLQSAYKTTRKAALDRLVASLPTPDDLERALEPEAPEPFSFIDSQFATGPVSPVARDLFAAWVALRFNWQLGYCEAKLAQRATGRKLSPRQQERAFSLLAWVCIAIIVLLHISFVAGEMFHVTLPLIETAVIWTALIALAGRALEDGLKPQREVERYEQYRVSSLVAHQRFGVAHNIETKLEIMRNFEQVSLEEMRTFVRTHARAAYLL